MENPLHMAEVIENDRSKVESKRNSDLKVRGTIQLEIPQLSQLTTLKSSYHMFANLPWRVYATTTCNVQTENVKYFSLYIECNPESESTLWSCEADVCFKLNSQQEDTNSFTRQFSDTLKFELDSNSQGFADFMSWNDIQIPEKGFVRSNTVIVEASVVIYKITGVRVSPMTDFSLAQGYLSDGILLVDGVRLYVSKNYLAQYSPVFAAMFYGEFRERKMVEVPLEGVEINHFTELLQIIYPSRKPITAENVEFLMELGDRFQIQFVMDACEKYLIGTKEIDLITKLIWADQYKFASLHDVGIHALKSTKEIKDLKSMDKYKKLGVATKIALLEKMFKFV